MGDQWKDMTTDTKARLIRELAGYQAQLFDHPFDRIGNLYSTGGDPREGNERGPVEFSSNGRATQRSRNYLGPINSPDPPSRSSERNDRGPYRCTRDWLMDRLKRSFSRHQRSLDMSSDEVRWKSFNPPSNSPIVCSISFPNRSQPLIQLWVWGSTRIFHHDLHEYNILIAFDQDQDQQWTRQRRTRK